MPGFGPGGDNSGMKGKSPDSSTNRLVRAKREAPDESMRKSFNPRNKSMKKSDEGAMFPKIQAPTVDINDRSGGGDESPDYNAGASANKGALECEESMSLTPSHASQTKEKQWNLTPQDVSTNRRVEHDETDNGHTTSPDFFSNQEGRKKTLSRATKEDAKMNLNAEIQKHMADTEYILSQDFHKLRLDFSQANIRITSLSEENGELKAELEARIRELQELSAAYNDQRGKVSDLEEHLMLIQQQAKDGAKLPTLRGQALENARTEIGQLTVRLQERDKRISELEHLVSQRETQQRADGKATVLFASETDV